jgi:hypothetical protein
VTTGSANTDSSFPEFGTGLRGYLARTATTRTGLDAEVGQPTAAKPEVRVGAAIRNGEFDASVDGADPAEGDVGEYLAGRAAENVELVWAAFVDALNATTSSGRPDHRTRLLAARSLLAWISRAHLAATKKVRMTDDLAELRRRRSRTGSQGSTLHHHS